MIDGKAVCERFFQCYEGFTLVGLADLFGVKHPSVIEWRTRGRVPWERLKYLSDSQAISWDWLILGITPVSSRKKAKKPKSTKPQFDRARINRRFLSLFETSSQTDTAKILSVTPNAVHEWTRVKSRVPWKRLDFAVNHFNVRWDWLLDGIEPKYRCD